MDEPRGMTYLENFVYAGLEQRKKKKKKKRYRIGSKNRFPVILRLTHGGQLSFTRVGGR